MDVLLPPAGSQTSTHSAPVSSAMRAGEIRTALLIEPAEVALAQSLEAALADTDPLLAARDQAEHAAARRQGARERGADAARGTGDQDACARTEIHRRPL